MFPSTDRWETRYHTDLHPPRKSSAFQPWKCILRDESLTSDRKHIPEAHKWNRSSTPRTKDWHIRGVRGGTANARTFLWVHCVGPVGAHGRPCNAPSYHSVSKWICWWNWVRVPIHSSFEGRVCVGWLDGILLTDSLEEGEMTQLAPVLAHSASVVPQIGRPVTPFKGKRTRGQSDTPWKCISSSIFLQVYDVHKG